MSFIDRLKAIVGAGPRPTDGGGAPSDMISCEEALGLIYEFLDGELEDVSHDRVKAHFDVCKKCYPNLKLEESFRSAVHRATGTEGAPAELRTRILGLLASAEDR